MSEPCDNEETDEENRGQVVHNGAAYIGDERDWMSERDPGIYQKMPGVTARTFIEGLNAHADKQKRGMCRDGQFVVLIISRGHPHGKSAVILEGCGCKVENVIQHGLEAVSSLGWYKVVST